MRLIDIDPIIEKLKNAIYLGKRIGEDTANLEAVLADIEAQPTAEKKGKWTHGKDMPPMKHRNGKPKKFWPSLKYCSCCGHEAFDDSDWGEQLFDFCPYCGAKMEN